MGIKTNGTETIIAIFPIGREKLWVKILDEYEGL